MVIMAPNRNRHKMASEAERQQQQGDSSSSSSSSSAKLTGKRNASSQNKESDEYRRKRERNNLAVKKSRSKSKMKTQETLERVNKLRAENEMLEAKIKLLSKELSFLKDLFLAHAGSAHGQTIQDIDLSMFGEPVPVIDDETDNKESNGESGPRKKKTVKVIVKTE